jgi:hypothetical protein
MRIWCSANSTAIVRPRATIRALELLYAAWSRSPPWASMDASVSSLRYYEAPNDPGHLIMNRKPLASDVPTSARERELLAPLVT